VEAIGLLEKAARLDPRRGDVYLEGTLPTPRWDGTRGGPILKRALARNPSWLEGCVILTVIYSELGRGREARAEAAEVMRLSPGYSLETAKQRIRALKDLFPALFSDARKDGLK
jgi:hypothetical protein